jgi:hypothetical protein
MCTNFYALAVNAVIVLALLLNFYNLTLTT